MNKIIFNVLLPSFILLAIVIFSVCQVGCKSSVEEIDVLEGDFSVPHVERFFVNDSRTLQIDFTKKIRIDDASVFSGDEDFFPAKVNASYSADGTKAFLEMPEKTEIGKRYVLEGNVVDENGNSLTFSIPFFGYNENPARVILSEVRNAYATANVKDDSGTTQKVHRSEYVEIFVLKGGNLCGIEVCSAADGDEKKYVMPSIEVKDFDYITVHMRTIDADGFDGEGMNSELGDDLALSTHEDSCSSSRDLWSENKKSCFADSDIVYLKNSYDGKIIDALVFAKSSVSCWRDDYDDVVMAVNESGVWGAEAIPENAVCSDGISTTAATRSFSRQNVTECTEAFVSGYPVVNGKDVWKITANSGSGKNKVQGVTPGYKNSSNEFIK